MALCDFVNQAAVSKVWAGNIMNDVWMMYGWMYGCMVTPYGLINEVGPVVPHWLFWQVWRWDGLETLDTG